MVGDRQYDYQCVTVVVDVGKDHPIGAIQTFLDVAGMVPVIGEACDAVGGIISAVRGYAVGAALSFASAIPVAGSVAGAAKIARTAIKTVDKHMRWVTLHFTHHTIITADF